MSVLALNRLAGLILSGPSLMTNIGTINSIISSWKSSPLQVTVLITAFMSATCDVLALTTLCKWFIQPDSFTDFTKYLIAYSFIKRVYSITIVFVTFLRYQATSGKQPRISAGAIIFTVIYALLSIATGTFQYLAYSTNRWVSLAARESLFFRYYYKAFNVGATSYYMLFAFYVDIRLVLLGSKNPLAKEKFRSLKIFHNHWVYLVHEFILFAAFWVGGVWGLFNSDITCSLYIEQALLSFMLFNGVCLVQAISTIHQAEPAVRDSIAESDIDYNPFRYRRTTVEKSAHPYKPLEGNNLSPISPQPPQSLPWQSRQPPQHAIQVPQTLLTSTTLTTSSPSPISNLQTASAFTQQPTYPPRKRFVPSQPPSYRSRPSTPQTESR